MKNILILCGIFLLSGCATLTTEQCKVANWPEIGEKDGRNGYSNRIEKHQKACAKINIIPDRKLYDQGYQKGLKSYCKPDIIFDRALEGNGGYRVCPSELHSTLKPYHDVANTYYQANVEKEKADKELDKYQDYLLDDKLSTEKRNEYIKIIRRLKQQKIRIDNDFNYAERELRYFQRKHYL